MVKSKQLRHIMATVFNFKKTIWSSFIMIQDAVRYTREHGLDSVLNDMMNKLLKGMPRDPYTFLTCEFASKRSIQIQNIHLHRGVKCTLDNDPLCPITFHCPGEMADDAISQELLNALINRPLNNVKDYLHLCHTIETFISQDMPDKNIPLLALDHTLWECFLERIQPSTSMAIIGALIWQCAAAYTSHDPAWESVLCTHLPCRCMSLGCATRCSN